MTKGKDNFTLVRIGECNSMEILKIIGKVLLTILRIPCTVWYIILGCPLKLIYLLLVLRRKIAEWLNKSTPADIERSLSHFGMFEAIITLEWASLLKFYHFHW